MTTGVLAGGLDVRDMLVRFCSELGMERELARDLDCSSLERLAAGLRAPCRTPRVVLLDARTLSELALPALAIVDETLAVLRKVSAKQVELELPGGRTAALARGTFVARAGGHGLELRPGLSREGGFVARLVAFLAHGAGDLTKLLLLSLLSSGLALTLPLATATVIDHALPDRSPKLLTLVSCGIFLIGVQRALFAWLGQRVAVLVHGKLELAVESRLFDHLLRIPFPDLVAQGVGSWLETMRGAQKLQDVLSEALLARLLDVGLVVVCGIALANQQADLALASLLAALVLAASSLALALRASRLERRLIETSAREGELLHELIDGVLTVRTAGAQRRGVLRWLERLLDARVSTVHIDRHAALSRFVLGGLRDAIGIGSFVWAAHSCMRGQLSVGALLSVVMLSERFVAATAQIASVFTPVLTARTHLARIEALLRLPDVTEGRRLEPVGDAYAGDALVLDDVWFRYGPDQPWILQGYSLRVPVGEHFALTGPSGMGKSTILRLIAGLYTPERGTVRVLGRPPRECAREIAYLPQQTHLFQGSILQNLRLLSDGASDDALREAAEQSGLAEFIATLPMGYETVLPPGGSTLSGGQRQLIAWTAAMASDRKVLLLDEALSQVDRIARGRLLAMGGTQARTTVAVEHAQTTI